MPHPEPLESLSGAIIALRDTFYELGIPHVFIGGVAVAATGRPRMTRDVDALVLLGEMPLSSLLDELKGRGIVPRIKDAEDFAAKHCVLLLEHKDSGIPIEVSLGMLPFEKEAIARSRERNIEGVHFRTPSPEDLIVMKAVAHRPQDMEDIRGIAAANPGLEREQVMRRLKDFAEALDSPDLLADVERILAER